MYSFTFGTVKQLNDHSFAWNLCISTTAKQFEESVRIKYEKYNWYSVLVQNDTQNLYAEYVMRCAVDSTQNISLRLLSQLYKLSIVDDRLRVIWSSGTRKDLFSSDRSFGWKRGQFLTVPYGIMVGVYKRLKAGKECSVKLDFMTEGDRKDEETDSGRASSCALAYKDIEALSEAVKELLLDEEDCDVTIAVQGREFKAHRIILKVRSPVFKRMFTHDMLEKKSGRVDVEDCDPDAFAIFHRYLYTGEAGGLTRKNVAPVYHLADRYEVASLRKICVLFISNNYDIEEFGDFAEIACLNSGNEDLAGTVPFLAKHFKEIADTLKWKSFLRRNLEGANEILKEMYQLLTVTQ